MKFVEKDNKLIFDVSLGKENYSQRNNEFIYKRGNIVVNGLGMCNVTSMVMALSYQNYRFPKGPYKQEEDNLAKFIFEEPKIDEYYKRISPYYDDWRLGKSGAFSPIEIHAVLSYGTNLWMGKTVTTFSESVPVDSIFEEITSKEKPVIISGKFGNLNHIVILVGLMYDKKETIQKSLVAMPTHIIYDDPYGKFNKATGKYEVVSGNNCLMTLNDFLDMIKPLKDVRKKWCHIFP